MPLAALTMVRAASLTFSVTCQFLLSLPAFSNACTYEQFVTMSNRCSCVNSMGANSKIETAQSDLQQRWLSSLSSLARSSEMPKVIPVSVPATALLAQDKSQYSNGSVDSTSLGSDQQRQVSLPPSPAQIAGGSIQVQPDLHNPEQQRQQRLPPSSASTDVFSGVPCQQFQSNTFCRTVIFFDACLSSAPHSSYLQSCTPINVIEQWYDHPAHDPIRDLLIGQGSHEGTQQEVVCHLVST